MNMKTLASFLSIESLREQFMFLSFQVLLELNELFPAVKAAEQAVVLDPTWAVAWQTLGRAQISLGEIEMVMEEEGLWE